MEQPHDKKLPKMCSASNAWISVFFQLSWICSRHYFCGNYTHFLSVNSSLSPVKNCSKAALLLMLQLQCAALKCRWDSVASVLKLHRFPPTATQWDVRTSLTLYIQAFSFQFLKHSLKLSELSVFLTLWFYSLKIMVYFVGSGWSSNDVSIAVVAWVCKKMKVYRFK